MKVTFAEDYKETYTLNDLETAKRVIKFQKENDCSKVEEYAEMAVREALKDSKDYLNRVVEAKAEARRNRRVWNLYGDDTKDMDIWVSAIAKTIWGFIEVGAYLSDINETGSKDYRSDMYVFHLMNKPADL